MKTYSAYITAFLLLLVSTPIAWAQFDPANAKILDSKKVQFFDPEKPFVSDTLEKAQIDFRQQPSVASSAEFTVKFLGANNELLKNYILNSDLIFECPDQNDFSITTKGKTFSGKGKVHLSFRDAAYKDGIFTASAVFGKAGKEFSFKIYLKKITELTSSLIAQSDITVGYGSVAGLCFRVKNAEQTAGTDFELTASIYNFRGELITEKPDCPVVLKLKTENPCVVNGSPVKEVVSIEPAAFLHGTAVLKIRCDKSVSCGLISSTTRSFSQSDGRWNSIDLKISHAAAEKTVLKIPASTAAGEIIQAEWLLSDHFDNSIDADSIDIEISPFTAGCVVVNSVKAESPKIKLLKGKTSLTFRKAEKYKIIAMKNEAVIDVRPSTPVRLNVQAPARLTAGESSKITITVYDAFENQTHLPSPVTLTADAEILQAKPAVISLADKTFQDIPLELKKTGKYNFVVTGFGTPIKKTIAVSPSTVTLSIDEKNIRKSSGDYQVSIPLRLTDQFGNGSELPVDYQFTAACSPKGYMEISGAGIVSQKRISGADRVSVQYTLKAPKNRTSEILTVRLSNTDFLELMYLTQKVVIPIKQAVAVPAAPKLRTTDTGVLEIRLASALSDEKSQMAVLDTYLNEHSAVQEISLVWNAATSGAAIRNQLTYYRKYGRLDFQSWDLSGKTRLKRILIRKISEDELKKAKETGVALFPGKREVY